MKVAIYVKDKNEDTGFVYYNPSDKSVMVTHDDADVRKRVRQYLKATKQFVVPGSIHVGSRRILEAKPIESIEFMDMGLCEMFHSIGVHVDWNSPENEGGSSYEPPTTVELEPPKVNGSVMKSLDGGVNYKIIN
jgi:hypothetical protein